MQYIRVSENTYMKRRTNFDIEHGSKYLLYVGLIAHGETLPTQVNKLLQEILWEQDEPM